MDEIDISTERAQVELEARIAAARNNAPHCEGAEFCEVCDEQVPYVRRQLGYSLCVPCAVEAERQRQIFGGRHVA
jgi:hypothetical protein